MQNVTLTSTPKGERRIPRNKIVKPIESLTACPRTLPNRTVIYTVNTKTTSHNVLATATRGYHYIDPVRRNPRIGTIGVCGDWGGGRRSGSRCVSVSDLRPRSVSAGPARVRRKSAPRRHSLPGHYQSLFMSLLREIVFAASISTGVESMEQACVIACPAKTRL